MDLTCPYCNKHHTAHDDFEGGHDPRPNDVSLCIGCGELGIFTQTSIRKVSPAERDALYADPQVLKVLAAWRAVRGASKEK